MAEQPKTLRAWRVEMGFTQWDMARKLCVHHSTYQSWEVHYAMKSARCPKRLKMLRIEKLTNGEVTANSWSCAAHDACGLTNLGDMRLLNEAPHEKIARKKREQRQG